MDRHRAAEDFTIFIDGKPLVPTGQDITLAWDVTGTGYMFVK